MKRIFLICLVIIGMIILNGCDVILALADTTINVCNTIENIGYDIKSAQRSIERFERNFSGSRRCSIDDMEQTMSQDSLYYVEIEPVYVAE